MAIGQVGRAGGSRYQLNLMSVPGQLQSTFFWPPIKTGPAKADDVSNYAQKRTVRDEEATDVEISNAFDPSAPQRNSKDIQPPGSEKVVPFNSHPVVYIDDNDDGDPIEITGARMAEKAEESSAPNKQSFRRSTDARGIFGSVRPSARTRDGRREHKSQSRNASEAKKNKGHDSTWRTPRNKSIINDLRNSRTVVQGGLPRTEILGVRGQDFMSEAEFTEYMKEISPPEEEMHEDDEDETEELPSEDALLDHLWTVIRAPLGVAASKSCQESVQGQKSEIAASGPTNPNLEPGTTVELRNGSFLRISSVRNTGFGRATIRGYKLVRDICCKRLLPDGRINEVVWYTEVNQDEHWAGLESVFIEVPISEVKQIRQIIFTNLPYPEVSFYQEAQQADLEHKPVDLDTAQEKGRLYCRWKYIQVNTRLKIDAEACLKLLDEEEAMGIGKREASEVRKHWRHGEEPIPGGSSVKTSFNVENNRHEKFRQYTFGDSFCGAGGVSRGAIQAGLRVAWGFDREESSIETYNKNFAAHGTMGLPLSDARFIDLIKAKPGQFDVDIGHYSPPCQAFSAANNHSNPVKDFNNQKSMFPVGDLTTLIKPRVATIEETAGLFYRHKEWFDVLVNMFTSAGYSIRWRILPCQKYGIAQSRVRLVLIAAAPGEKLPKIPEATHGDARSGLKPWVKIRDIIYNIHPSATQQHIISKSRKPHLLSTYSDDTFAKCITTGGGQFNHHPSGSRKYSVRELASLQGFPWYHHFSLRGVSIAQKEIGNAVPPPLAKLIFESIIKSLKETDCIND